MDKQNKNKQESKVKRLLTPAEKELVNLISKIIVANTISKASTEIKLKYKNDQ